MSRLLIPMMLLLAVAPAVAQPVPDELDPMPHWNMAIDAGYQIIATKDHYRTPDREFVDETFMTGIVDRFGQEGQRYGFGFIKRDLTGDGVDDVILIPKMVGLYPPSEYAEDPGAAIFVYVQDTSGVWRLEIEAGTMSIGIREGERTGGAFDLALIQQFHLDEFFWDGEDFVRRASR